MKIHLIAIGGTGMGAFALMLREAGHEVRGSDGPLYPPMSTQLEAARIAVATGFRGENLDWQPDVVVVGNACRRDNVEVVAAQKRGQKLASFPALLGDLFLEGHRSIVVAGTHGKTTTTALIAWLLEASGRDPSFLVGGVPQNFGRGSKLGRGVDFVVEGDEYDTAFFDKGPKFLHYRPKTLVITSIEYDHADIYPNVEAIEARFRELVALVPPEGHIVACADEPRVLAAIAGAKARVTPYRLTDATDVSVTANGTTFSWRGRRVQSPLFGNHNLLDTLAALSAVPEADSAGLATFMGVKRRQEVIGEPRGMTVIDDFAHHPTAVRETLACLALRYPTHRLIAVFEPRTQTSRRAVFQELYATAFDAARIVVIAVPFGADALAPEARFDAPRLARDLLGRGIDAHAIESVEAIVESIAAFARPDDVVAILSNGGFGGLHAKLLSRLANA
jgi:UDP-N-acetylmuramate: L-alanyl-gamma-D-glutamyl-meso-diaminopimelate ligase